MELTKKVYINSKLSNEATERLLSFVVEDNSSLKLDSLELSINNSDDNIQIPKSQATIELEIGCDDGLLKMGKFIAQNIEATSTSINIKAISQDLSKGRVMHKRVFKQKSLDDVLKTLANEIII